MLISFSTLASESFPCESYHCFINQIYGWYLYFLICVLLVSSLLSSGIWMVIGLDLMLLSNRTKWHVDRLSDNFVDGRKLYVDLNLSQSFISCSLRQQIPIALILCLCFWIISLLSLRLVMLIRAWSICATRDFSLEVCLTVSQGNQEPMLSTQHMLVLLDTRWYWDC